MRTVWKREVNKLAKSIRGNRTIGSIETVEDVDEEFVADVAQKYGLVYTLLHDPLDELNEVYIVMLRPSAAAKYLRLYRTYIEYPLETNLPGKESGLTLSEHEELGAAFGFTPKEVRRDRLARESTLAQQGLL